MTSSSEGPPRLSVIIPVYNQAHSLRRCIESVQRQTLRDIEIVLVDDGSTDGSRALAEELAGEDDRIAAMATENNGGPGPARNLGIHAARAPFIATLDADDVYLDAGKLEAELALASSRASPTRAAIGYSRHLLLDEDLAPLSPTPSPADLPSGDLLEELLSRPSFIPRDFVFPKALYLEVGGYDPTIPIYEDWDLKLRLAARADFHPTDLDGSGYVQHPAGLSRSHPAEHESWLGAVFRKNLHLLEDARQERARAEFAGYLEARGWVARIDEPQPLSERQRLGEGLVFLISMPRAGSTLTQRLLTGHPAIHSRSESWLMLQPLLARRSDMVEGLYNQDLAALALDEFVSHLPGGEADYLYRLRECYAGLYQDALARSGATRFLDKTPRYHLIWPDLMALFPRAKFVLLWRHPLAVLHSMYEMVGCEDARMDVWQVDLQRGLDNLLALRRSGRALELYYEDLLADPEGELRRITDHLQLPFERAMLDLGDGDGEDWRMGDRKTAFASRELLPSRQDHWRTRLDALPGFAALADSFLEANEPLLRELRYDVDEMRRHVPQAGCAWTEALMDKTGLPPARPVMRYQIDRMTRLERWRRRLQRFGPVPYAIGRLAWLAYKGVRPRTKHG